MHASRLDRRRVRENTAMSALAKLRPFVNLDVGYIGIGFTRQNDRDRQQIAAAASSERENLNSILAEAISDADIESAGDRAGLVAGEKSTERGSLWALLMSFIPRELLTGFIRTYQSELYYTHCEIAMFLNGAGKARYGADCVLGIGLNIDRGVFISPRKYNDKYAWLYVRCDKQSALGMLSFALGERSKNFCARSMSQVATYPGPDRRNRYFCSQFVMACLEFLKLPAFHLNPVNKLTIDDVYELASQSENKPQHVSEAVATHLDAVFGIESRTPPPRRIDPEHERRFANPT